MIPRGTTHTFELDDGHQALALLPHPRRDRNPQPVPQPLPAASRARAVLAARLPGAVGLETRDESGEFPVDEVRDGYQEYLLDRHPFDAVGWDGYVWPYAFNADDFEPRAGRFHLPPPTHQTFQEPNAT